MSEWKESKLGAILNLITKGTTPPQGVGFVEKGINYIKSDAIDYNGKLNKSRFAQIDLATHEKFKRSHLVEDDILFSMAGIYLGKNAIVPKDVLPANTNQALAILRLNQEKTLPRYVSYYLSQPQIIDFVNNMSGQSAQPNINFEEIKSIEITLPPLPEQRAIASILSGLDDKIDLLHRQNATLEAMAETLFRQWFVEEAKEEWEEITLYDAIDLIGGGTPKTSLPEYWDGDIKWLSGGDIANNHKSIIISSEKSITELGIKNSSAKLLPKFSTIISARGTVGKYCILSEPMTFSQSNYGIKPKYESCFFFTYLLIAHSVDELISAAYGSVFDTITTDTFKGHSVTLPKLDVIKNFEIEVTPLFQKMLNNQIQIRTLTALRDTLLPKLMSGEVRVEDV
ncbi:MAG: restriction endonuclease subunit S [Bacteroidetes bacterium]|nr:restriction endonuclease subunit S [Bacteroidota bacterium]MCL6103719.1 restriction endonuclease subunit S [Bacteroidota bacterium]